MSDNPDASIEKEQEARIERVTKTTFRWIFVVAALILLLGTLVFIPESDAKALDMLARIVDITRGLVLVLVAVIVVVYTISWYQKAEKESKDQLANP